MNVKTIVIGFSQEFHRIKGKGANTILAPGIQGNLGNTFSLTGYEFGSRLIRPVEPSECCR